MRGAWRANRRGWSSTSRCACAIAGRSDPASDCESRTAAETSAVVPRWLEQSRPSNARVPRVFPADRETANWDECPCDCQSGGPWWQSPSRGKAIHARLCPQERSWLWRCRGPARQAIWELRQDWVRRHTSRPTCAANSCGMWWRQKSALADKRRRRRTVRQYPQPQWAESATKDSCPAFSHENRAVAAVQASLYFVLLKMWYSPHAYSVIPGDLL